MRCLAQLNSAHSSQVSFILSLLRLVIFGLSVMNGLYTIYWRGGGGGGDDFQTDTCRDLTYNIIFQLSNFKDNVTFIYSILFYSFKRIENKFLGFMALHSKIVNYVKKLTNILSHCSTQHVCRSSNRLTA